MAIYQTDWYWFSGFGDGYHTVDINIPPAWIGAEVSLHGTFGDGTVYAGIVRYRRRLSSGRDEDVAFAGWPAWPPAHFGFVSSVTFGLAVTRRHSGWAIARMDYWRR